ncbi:Chaperone modulatory protein CbpM [Escherichia coli]|nr:Chaperone modulatory protein CbpM [Escherichia coli]
MANVTVTFTITEFCLHTGISEEELNEIVGLGWLNRVRSRKQPGYLTTMPPSWCNAQYACVMNWLWTGLGSRWR